MGGERDDYERDALHRHHGLKFPARIGVQGRSAEGNTAPRGMGGWSSNEKDRAQPPYRQFSTFPASGTGRETCGSSRTGLGGAMSPAAKNHSMEDLYG